MVRNPTQMNKKLQEFFERMAVQFGCGLSLAQHDDAKAAVRGDIDSFVLEAEEAFGKDFDTAGFRHQIRKQNADLQ